MKIASRTALNPFFRQRKSPEQSFDKELELMLERF
jgi:hypothetical protein